MSILKTLVEREWLKEEPTLRSQEEKDISVLPDVNIIERLRNTPLPQVDTLLFDAVSTTVMQLDEVCYRQKTPEEWYARYNGKGRVITHRDADSNIDAYLLYCGVTDELYAAIRANVLDGDYSINPAMFVNPDITNNIYLASICVRPGREQHGIANKLLSRARKKLAGKNVIMLRKCKQVTSGQHYTVIEKRLKK